MYKKQNINIANVNMVLAIVQIILVLIPLCLLFMAGFSSESDPELMYLLGLVLIVCSIPMACVLFILVFFVIISTIFVFKKSADKRKLIVSLSISIIILLVGIMGTYYYFDTMIDFVDTISRLG